jgi:hypothetical protein
MFAATEDGMRLMAVFVSGLIKEGVTFKIEDTGAAYRVILTGGF